MLPADRVESYLTGCSVFLAHKKCCNPGNEHDSTGKSCDGPGIKLGNTGKNCDVPIGEHDGTNKNCDGIWYK